MSGPSKDWISELEKSNPRARSTLAALERFAARAEGKPLPKIRAPKGSKPAREFPLEADEQKEAVKLLAAMGITAVAVPNGAHLAGGEGERIRKWGQLQALGARKGFPDLILFSPRGVAFIEMKRQRVAYKGPRALADSVPPEQRKWLGWLSDQGFPVCVAYGAAEAVEAAQKLLRGEAWETKSFT